MLILAGDIGGTKTYLGLFEASGGGLRQVDEERFVNADFSGPEEVFSSFIKRAGGAKVAASSLGVAAPVFANRCTLTNLGWVLDANELGRSLGIPAFALINDLVATGWGIRMLAPADLHTLQEGVKRPGNAALIAAGTGLGESILFADGEALLPTGSEGGHTDFAPRNDVEVGLFNYLRARYGHVSYERVLSGAGLGEIYEYLRDAGSAKEPQELAARFSAEPAAAVVTSVALSNGDPVCVEALRLFVSIYGAEAGNLALKCMGTAGVYVGGGIAPKILKAMEEGSAFIEAFIDKGRYRELLSTVPVKVILNEKTALLGAAHYATLLK